MSPPMKPTKPAPPPPKLPGRMRTTPRCERATGVAKHLRYSVPVRSQYDPEWRATLRDAGYPTIVVVLDFETYFDAEYSMRGDKLSTIEYIMDERFEVLGLSVLGMAQPFDNYGGRTHFWSGEQGAASILAHLQREYGQNLENCTIVAQNAVFDTAILAYRYNIRPPYIVDILGLARHWNSRAKNDLEHLCRRFDLPAKGETTDFKGVTFRKRLKKPKTRKKGPKLPQQTPRITDEQLVALRDYANNDVKREWELFTLLMPKLSCPSTELRILQHTLDLFLHPALDVDLRRGEKLIGEMDAEIDQTVNRLNTVRAGLRLEPATRKDIAGGNSFEALLYDALVVAGDDPARYAKGTKQKNKEWMFAIAKDDPQREWLEQHEDEHVRLLIEARNAAKSWPLHMKRVRRIINQGVASGRGLPVSLKYHGAHTGRWSGGEKINLQNLGSRGHELVNAVRELLIAKPGQELVIADASQIEARVLAWIAGQWDLVEKFANGEEIYCGFAERVLGYPVRKPKAEGGIPAIEKRMKWARNSVGKVGVLGCGYGMGSTKAVGYAKGAIDFETAERLVKTYREENDKIVQFWRGVERAFIYTAKYGEPCEMPRGLRFDQTPDCDVIITLPNGRELKYHQVKIEPDQYGDSIKVWNDLEKSSVHVWGGYLTENVVQAISRDLLWAAIQRLEDEGHRVALHVHDELIITTPKGTGQRVLNRAIAALGTRPAWAADCPLAAEGVVTERYGGH